MLCNSASAYIYCHLASLIFMLSTPGHLFHLLLTPRPLQYEGVTPSPRKAATNTEAEECSDIMVIFFFLNQVHTENAMLARTLSGHSCFTVSHPSF